MTKDGLCRFCAGVVTPICSDAECDRKAFNKGLCQVCVGYNRCPLCKDWPDSRGGSKNFDGNCARCFKRAYPNDPRSRYIPTHVKELMVQNEINKHFAGFVHNKCLRTSHCDCSMQRRIDHYMFFEGTLLGVETDEFCHIRYDPEDEKNRYNDIFMKYGGQMIFIRFNPDLKGVSMQRKLATLIEEMKTQIAFIESGKTYSGGFLKEIKLFYYDLPHRSESTW